MKKLLAVLLVLTMFVVVLPSFAQEGETSDFYNDTTTQIVANDTSAVYENGVTYYRQFNHSDSACFHLVSTGLTTALDSYNRYQLRKQPLVYKIPLPKLNKSQELEEFNVHFTSGTSNLGTTYIVKFEGEGWENIEGISSAHEKVAPIVSNQASYDVKDSPYEKITATGGAGTSYSRVKANITSYAKECIEKKQAYLYVGLVCNYTTSAYGFKSRAGEIPIVSFKTKAWNGLKTVKKQLPWEDVASVAGSSYTCPLTAHTSIHRDGGNGPFAMFEMPLPELEPTQSVVDYKLYVGLRSNMSSTGYNKVDVYKVPQGGDYFENQWSYSEHPIAVNSNKIDGSKNWMNRGSMNYDWKNNGYSQYEYMSLDLTAYAKELLTKETPESAMYAAIRDNTGSTVSIYGSDSSYKHYVEYTIYDTAGYESGLKNLELKIVPSTITYKYSSGKNEAVGANNFGEAVNESSLTAGTAYRAVMKASNYDSASKILNMYVATYSQNELESVIPVECNVEALDSDVVVWSSAFTPEAGETVKAFLWDGDDITPLTLSREANVVAAATE